MGREPHRLPQTVSGGVHRTAPRRLCGKGRRRTMTVPEIVLLIAVLALAGVQVYLLWRLRGFSGERPAEALREAVKQMQQEEQRLRSEQTANTNETIRLSMQMMSDSLSQNQAQTRDTTAVQLKQFEERIRGLEAQNARSMTGLRETLEGQLELLRDHSDKRLREIRTTVDDTLQSHIDAKMTESFQRVSESLEAVYRGLGEMKTLAADVGGLKRVLSNVKTRGTLGEIQLHSILSDILAPGQYECNVETVPGSGRRVEFAVRLPADDGRAIYLPIDSKFPADCYTALLDAQESGDKAAADAAAGVLRQRLQAFAKDIREKYIREPETTAFGILFLPFEGLYSEAVMLGMPEILHQKYSVTLAGPSTMAAMLNALYMGFRTLAIQRQSDQVWEILGGVKAEFEQFETVLTSTQRRLELAGKDLDQLIGARTRAINRRLEQVQRLELAEPAKEEASAT
ncbi:MAG: DNA recombination protein RmuC [Oscillospiraceae bacterium]|nr:DNA recombination protein RmuC [Oscillospiraceae bacterium]